ncbi:uncharacterized protein BX663DRAFT_503939 [Cokeromyces recurvatus]|uniref:uncharacterized protein n=1 Tax=Cokeromyces recurvatus TaxID=90255 RepID=UPI002220B9B1|nr:uncharacterized protein BX663DRAFT_503939 [Cokeromyces recurvatus]KAI7904891.1 hypothetical protein BX663DRAFT_503939 [Cokeromyces recurvatus]
MNTLPLEIRIKILDILSTTTKELYELSLVNHDWNLIVSTTILYKSPALRSKNQFYAFLNNITAKNQFYIQHLDLTFVHEYVHKLDLNYMTNLKYINLSKCTRLSPFIIFQLIKNNIKGLQRLVLANCTISSDILKSIGQAANQQQLECLDLTNTMIQPCIAIDASNHLEDMLLLDQNQLRYLNLSYCTWVNSQTIENIAYGLPKLEIIILQWCNQIQLKSIIIMVQQLEYLKMLDIQHIDTIENKKQVLKIIKNTRSALLKKIVFTCKKTVTIEVAL